MKTRPARFEMTANFNHHGPARQYRITEPAGTYVVDASSLSGRDPGTRDRCSVRASIGTRWTGSTPTDYRGRTVFVVTTKGVSNHGSAKTTRDFDTLNEAERFIAAWARRRWRVAV